MAKLYPIADQVLRGSSMAPPVSGYRKTMTKPFDAHDDEERGEILAVLRELPDDHPAWAAHKDGADALKLTHVVDGRKDLIDGLIQAWTNGYNRMLRRSANFKPRDTPVQGRLL